MNQIMGLSLIVAALLGGCGDTDDDSCTMIWPSPEGYIVCDIEDRGSFGGAHITREEVSAGMSKRIDAWVASREGVFPAATREYLYRVAKAYRYHWVDAYRFSVGIVLSDSGYATGMITGDHIQLAIWEKRTTWNHDEIPADTLPWTIERDARYGYGYGYRQSVFCPAVNTELDHAIGRHH